MVDKLIKNGIVVTHTGRFRGNLAIRDGKICAVTGPEEPVEAAEVIDATGKYVIPGLIDSHVHFQDPGFTDREDFEHGTAAGAAGGVTTAISHPLNDQDVYVLFRGGVSLCTGRHFVPDPEKGGGK